MTIGFVAGATGYTGRAVVRLLREAGCEVVAHVRPDSPGLERWRTRFEGLGATTDTTPWEAVAMAATMRRLHPDLVFALLGTTRARAKTARASRGEDAGYEAVDYGLTMLLYGAVGAEAPTARFVYLSSVGAGLGKNPYLDVRGRVEQVLRAGTVPFTIARPSFITGPDRDEVRPGERIAAAIGDGVLAVAGRLGGQRLQARYRSTSNGVLAKALVHLALDPAAAGWTFESEELR